MTETRRGPRPRPPGDVLTRPAASPDLVLRYGPTGAQVVDVRLPLRAAGDAPAPLVVLLHGGFWRAAWDRVHTRPLADALAAAGYAVAMPEYRRTGMPGGGWPGTFEDVAAALAGLPARILTAAPSAVDPARVVLAGHSAGGDLALWAAARSGTAAQLGAAARLGAPARLSEPSPCGVLALAPVADLAAAHRLDLDGGAVAELLGGGPGEVPDRYGATDPCALPTPGVPVLVLHGLDDRHVPVSLSRAYAAAHPTVRLRELVGVDHFGLIDPRSAAWPPVLEAVRTLLALR